MSRKKTGAFLRIGVFLMVALLMVASAVRPVGALTEQEYNLYWQNSIFFYDPYECLGDYGGGDEENEGGGDEQQLAKIEWDGNCSNVSSYDARIRQYRDAVKQVADQNGLPWEGIMAQMILESGFMSHEACSHNPLGLKGQPSCDGQHRSFNSYEEAFNYYVNSIKSVRLAIQKGTFANDPYGYIDFLINGVPYGSQYTTEPTYVTLASAIVCGLQKWADANGYPISGDGSPNPSSPLNPSSPSDSSTSSSGSDDGYTSPNCPGSKKEEPGGGGGSWDDNDDDDDDDEDDDEDEETPEGGDLVDLLKAWVWSDYKGSGYTEKKKAYADYIANHATYKGGCEGVDCGAFVANIMKASGWDTSYAQGPTSTQNSYLQKNWKRVSADSLQLGDVGIGPGHVLLYIGNIPGINSNIASASLCDRAPMADRDNVNKYTWYRKP